MGVFIFSLWIYKGENYMTNLELLKSGGFCFCVKYTEKDKDILDNYLTENNFILFHPSPGLRRWPGYYINYDTKIYASGIIGVMVVKPIGRSIISVDEFLTIVNIFDKRNKVW